MSTKTTLPSTYLASSLLTAIALAGSIRAQCSTQWQPGEGAPGTNGTVYATVEWDPDGAGPASAVAVVAGQFWAVGNILAANIATYDRASGIWAPLGLGLNHRVHALVVMPNGDLVAGGIFAEAGGVVANRVARWNGSAWAPVGSGFSPWVNALAVMPNGDLVAGHDNGAARWNGTTWTTITTNKTYALTALPNGDLVAGMEGGIRLWNGTSWSVLGSAGGQAALLVMPNGDLVAGAVFTGLGQGVARWDGTAWSLFGSGMNNPVRSLKVLPNGDLLAGGDFTVAGGVSAPSVARWDGTSWLSLGSGTSSTSGFPSSVRGLAVLPTGEFLVAGHFDGAGGLGAFNVAVWDGSSWMATCPGRDGSVDTLAVHQNGDLLAAGTFRTIEGVSANRVARYDGTAWAPLGTGVDGGVRALAVLPGGDIVAGGSFTMAGGVSANRIARWDGTTWWPLAGGLSTDVRRLAVLPGGVVIAAVPSVPAGNVNTIMRWDGTAWSSVGLATGGQVHALAVRANGDLVVGGYFTGIGGVAVAKIASWNGSSWSALGAAPPLAGVTALTTLPDGSVVAGGPNQTNARAARWNGTSWSLMGFDFVPPFPVSASVDSLTVLADGDVLMVGLFSAVLGVPMNHVSRWNGTFWQPVGSGTSALGPGAIGYVEAAAQRPNGDIFVCGPFSLAGGQLSPGLARCAPTCPATSSPWGTGCASSGGANTLVATSLPWVDTTFRATGTGLPSTAIVVAATSVSPIAQGQQPLSWIFSQALPGCDLLVAPDILQAMVTTSGTAQSSLFLPIAPPLVGVTFYHQMVPIELDANGDWVAITATNALQLTAGVF